MRSAAPRRWTRRSAEAPLGAAYHPIRVTGSPSRRSAVRLEQLEYLAAVTRHGSLRRASEELHVSQPALSESLRNLERELGVTLLDRRRTGARINTQGRELLPAMSEVLEAVDRLRVAAGDQGVVSRIVRIGTVNAGTS